MIDNELLLRIFKPILLINAFKIITGKKKMSEQSIRKAYALEYGTDAMEYGIDAMEYGIEAMEYRRR